MRPRKAVYTKDGLAAPSTSPLGRSRKRRPRRWALHKKSWAVIDRPYSLGFATVGALYERPRYISCARPFNGQGGSWYTHRSGRKTKEIVMITKRIWSGVLAFAVALSMSILTSAEAQNK